MKTNALAGHFGIARLLKYCLGPIFTMILTSVYGIVDGFFVSNYAGATPFAAINLIMPALMILSGFGFMFGTGGAALCAKTLGENQPEKASRIFSMMVEISALTGLVISILGIIFMPQICTMLGANSEMLYDAVTYGRVILFFNTFFVLQMLFQAFLPAAGQPNLGFGVTLIAGITNMVLDWLFIAVFGWGVQGAAIATGIGQVIGCVLPLLYFVFARNSLLRFRLTSLKPAPIFKAAANGSSELVSNVSSSITGIAFNFQLLRFAGESGIAAYGVMMYVSMIFVAIAIGFTIGTGPMISYSYGAGNTAELQSLFKKSVLCNGVTGIVMVLLAEGLAGPLAHLFVGYDPALMALTVSGFRLFSLMFFLSSLNIFFSAFFTALNNGLISALLSFSRTLIFALTFVFVLPVFLGIDGIWLAMVAAEAASFVLALVLLKIENRKYHYLPGSTTA